MGRAYAVREAKIKKTGAARGKLYTNFAKEIYLAAKRGVPEIEANSELKHLVEKAKKQQVPADIINRAIEDEAFKTLLIEQPEEAMKGYNLTEVQQMLIKTLTKDDIEKLTGENIEEYFSADAAVYTPDIESEILIDEAEEDDI